MFYYATDHGYVNLSEITRFFTVEDSKGRIKQKLQLKDGRQFEAGGEFTPTTHIVQIIPADGYELIYYQEEDDGGPDLFVATIIAWGLDITGAILPVTTGLEPRDMSGLCGIRKIGNPQIDIPDDSVHDNEESFIKHCKERVKQRRKDAAMAKEQRP